MLPNRVSICVFGVACISLRRVADDSKRLILIIAGEIETAQDEIEAVLMSRLTNLVLPRALALPNRYA
jgi:hypothetical protein